MQKGQRRVLQFVTATIVGVVGIWLTLWALGTVPPPGQQVGLFQMSDRLADLQVVDAPEGMRFQFEDQQLTAEEFALNLRDRRPEGKRSWLFATLNITSVTGLLWVGIGLLGQALFTGRMVVQWIASEKEKRSVVPDVFWWMSLGGATMLIVYFVWRVDIVGVLGQSTGWFIYLRNLWFIYSKKPPS
ncbi:MAG: lipid-A-disaccharide synthase-like uncharacterized protein [Verrucomicrobiales bacterium]|jgi:lipid-A-disaccharide synthase-like uncharacterized protein